MLNSPFICQTIAAIVFGVGAYLAIFNTWLSAVVIGQRSGLGLLAGVVIAVALTAVELWFAAWARHLSHWTPLIKAYRSYPEKTAIKLASVGFGLALVYHFDIDSTWRSIEGNAIDSYYFLWALAWLVIGPELTISLSEWLKGVAKQAERKNMNQNNSRDADHAFLREQRTTMIQHAKRAGRDSALKKISDRFGPKAVGEGRIDT